MRNGKTNLGLDLGVGDGGGGGYREWGEIEPRMEHNNQFDSIKTSKTIMSGC